MSIQNKSVKIDVFAYKKGQIVSEHAITTVFADGNSCKIQFVSGVGLIVEAPVDAPNNFIGKTAVFCGYSDAEIENSITTSTNNIACVQDAPKGIYAICGDVAIIINAIQNIGIEVGMRVAIEASTDDRKILTSIISSYGCTTIDASAGKSDADKGIVYCTIPQKIQLACRENSEIAIISAPPGGIDIQEGYKIALYNEPGALACSSGYSREGNPIPYAYIANSVSGNLRAAAKLVHKGILDWVDCGTLIALKPLNMDTYAPSQPVNCDTGSILIGAISGMYRGHILPGTVSVSVWLPFEKNDWEFICAVISTIVKSAPKSVFKYKSDEYIYIYICQCEDGTVVNCSIICSKVKRLRIELNYDGTTVVYDNEVLSVYTNEDKSVKKEYPLDDVFSSKLKVIDEKWEQVMEVKS